MTSNTATTTPTAYYRFKPWNVGRIVIWGMFALLLIVAPHLFTSSLALTMLSQIGYLIIICLSYNMLLGQGGMLSFGHAVYTGLGSFIAIHAMNLASKGSMPIPLVLIPLVGGVAGMLFAVLLGYVTTKKAGTTFAMITMGIGELVASMARTSTPGARRSTTNAVRPRCRDSASPVRASNRHHVAYLAQLVQILDPSIT